MPRFTTSTRGAPPVRASRSAASRAGHACRSRTPNPNVNESPSTTMRYTPAGLAPGSAGPRKPAAFVRTGTRNSGRASTVSARGVPASGVKRGSTTWPTRRSVRTRTANPEPTARPRVARATSARRMRSGVPPPWGRMRVDLRRCARGVQRTRRPPAPLDAVDARGRREVAVHVLLAQRAHPLAVPGREHAVVDVAERRLDVVVALARDQRAVPEDVAVVPEVRARATHGRSVA